MIATESEMFAGAAAAPQPLAHALRHYEAIDIDAYTAGLPRAWDLQYDQLSCGRFHGVFTEAVLPQMHLFREVTNQTLRQRGAIGPGYIALGVPTTARDDGYFGGQRVRLDTMLVGYGKIDFCSPAQSDLMGVTVDAQLLQDLWQRIHADRQVPWSAAPAGLAIPDGVMHALRDRLWRALQMSQVNPALVHDASSARLFQDALLCELLETMSVGMPLTDIKSAAARRKIVQKACDLVLSNPEAPISILDLCSQVGASRRKLQYCFQDALGMGPQRYLRAARLNAVRRELRHAQESGLGVKDIAARWGFWHFSNFAADYKRQFGELPSDTLKRATGESSDRQH
ncbi:helix-turn-helix domain-containing protein [Ralstonia soli]|uniref:Helix-turn-helix domain-containing protein n=1 Tax=Ralstonia soli TaxID=2953896 RepID=A0ABT1AHR1_9RALS|nr:helix-turn-helix domain-containing protein [Ralstonia soli]MCO5397637.1 helix-turn-helix domain-containing protein [Ralstonia soli]